MEKFSVNNKELSPVTADCMMLVVQSAMLDDGVEKHGCWILSICEGGIEIACFARCMGMKDGE